VIQLPPHRWRPTSSRELLWVVGIVVVLAFVLFVLCSYLLGWKGTGFPGRTAWDWLDLLIVPVVLVIGGYLLTKRQRSLDREVAADQTRADRDIADRRRQDDALQAYFDYIGKLMLDNDKPLRQSKEGDVVRTLARARTSTVLRRLDSGRKGSIVQFLYESDLITTGRSVLSLARADLSAADLIAVDLNGANLSGANLGDADLKEASLRRANLYGADLSGAELCRAFLGGANLYGADLSGANLSGANLSGANLREANLYGADLSGAKLCRAFLGGADLSGARLGDADLKEASLRRANLFGADLKEVDLKEVDLSGAKLGDADLRWSDMRATLGWTEGQYSAAMSLYGAMMPDGQALGGDEMRNGPTFEDWIRGLKEKEYGGDGEEHRGLS
jgi:uncharacterized protein YjbI with pentapeptide repeats